MNQIVITPRYQELAKQPWGFLNKDLFISVVAVGGGAQTLLNFPQTNDRAARTAFNYIMKSALKSKTKSFEIKLFIKYCGKNESPLFEEILKLTISTGNHQFAEIMKSIFFNEGIFINNLNQTLKI